MTESENVFIHYIRCINLCMCVCGVCVCVCVRERERERERVSYRLDKHICMLAYLAGSFITALSVG